MSDLRYPIGKFQHSGPVSDEELKLWLSQIETLPARLRGGASQLTDSQLDTRYRPGGWTLRQVVHHLVDSHLNSYVRFKLALTEDTPTIKPYDEARWAELPDSRLPIAGSLEMLSLLHERWVALLRMMSREEFSRRFLHPEAGPMELDWTVGLYAWHGRHHLAHIRGAIEREGWGKGS